MTHTLPSFLLESAVVLLIGAPLTVWFYRWADKRLRGRWEKKRGDPMPNLSVPEVLLTGALLWCALVCASVLAGRLLHRDPLNFVSGATISVGLYISYYGIWRGRTPWRS